MDNSRRQKLKGQHEQHDGSNGRGKRGGKDRRSERHIRYQMRLADILAKHGFVYIETEKRFPYYLPTGKFIVVDEETGESQEQIITIPYRLDVTGRRGSRHLAIEVDGYLGHKSRRAYEMDGLRSRRIQEAYGPIDIYRFTFGQLASWTDEEIAQEMNLRSK